MTVHDKSILLEREVRLDKGQFTLSKTLKMVRLEDRIQFLHAHFSGKPLQGQIEWWSRLNCPSTFIQEQEKAVTAKRAGVGLKKPL